MNARKSIQGEGLDYGEAIAIPFTAVEAQYVVGTAANAALAGSWPQEGGVPSEAQSVTVVASQACLIRLVPLWMVTRQALPSGDPDYLPAGLPVQRPLPAGIWLTFNEKVLLLYVVRVAVNGTLTVYASG